jgi:hypothetical protein
MSHAIQSAILTSIRENRTVTLTECIETTEWTALAESLGAECEDYVEHTIAGIVIREYWGLDEDGDGWRIHLQGSAPLKRQSVAARIEALQTSAATAGDLLQVAICQIALQGEPD